MNINPRKYELIAKAARLAKRNPSTVDAAIRLGNLPTVALADGTLLVAVADVKAMPKRKAGRPKKA